MIARTMSVEVRAISLGAETRPTTESVNVEVMTGTSRTVTVVASKTTTAGTDFIVLDSVKI